MQDMIIEMAPMEGITTATFRRVYMKWFTGIDRVYTPFLVANQTHRFKTREKREIEHCSPALIPQILTDRAEHFIWAAALLKKAGYTEINLNAGCPSATVTTKRKGAGMLRDLSSLRSFFDEVFSAGKAQDLPEISVKTRVGVSSYDEASDIADLYAAYPLSCVIVHPRISDDLYEHTPNREAFGAFYDRIPHERLIYNGDLKTVADTEAILAAFPGIRGVMIGRGLLADPFLPRRTKSHDPRKDAGFSADDRSTMLGFLGELYDAYESDLSEGTALLKMKDLWNFIAPSFPGKDRQLKAIRKSRSGMEYKHAVETLMGTLLC